MIGKNQKFRLGLLTSLLIFGLLAGLVGEVNLVAAQTAPVAINDTYGFDVLGYEQVIAPGVLFNDTYVWPVTLTVTSGPTNGLLTLNGDGSFTYNSTAVDQNDSFTYKLCDSSGLCDSAVVSLIAPIPSCTVDMDGSNDENGQADMTQMCQDVSPFNEDEFGLIWDWDDVNGTGDNAYFSCALFDTNTNGFIDIAVCVQVAGIPLVETGTYTYVCNDKYVDKCDNTPLVEVPAPEDTCTVAHLPTDPFPRPDVAPPADGTEGGQGSDYPIDTVATCSIPETLVGDTATLVNVCSYTSKASPNSNPFDCVVDTGQVKGYITVVKVADPSESPDPFEITTKSFVAVEPPTEPPTYTDTETELRVSSFYGTNAETFFVDIGKYSVNETSIPAGWELTGSSCTLNGTQITTGLTGVEIDSYDNLICTFYNQANIDLMVTKSDGDFDRGTTYLSRGDTFTYTIDVEYALRDLTGPTGIIAHDVVMTDTLDSNLQYEEGTLSVDSYTTSVEPACEYNSTNREITCTVAEMTYEDTYSVSFDVLVLDTAPITGLIETGTCDQTTHQGTSLGYYIDPITGEPVEVPPITGPVDLCNIVEVETTSSYEALTSNNFDSEPADVGRPTAVDLISFEAIGQSGSILLTWTVGSETETLGYNLYRAASLKGKRTLLTETPIFVTGGPYEYEDVVKSRNTFYYWLESVDLSGGSTIYDIVPFAKALK